MLLHRRGKSAEGTHIPGKGRGTGPRQVGEQEREQAAQQQETEAEAGAGEGSLGGALHLQVGPIPLLDLGFDLKVFSEKDTQSNSLDLKVHSIHPDLHRKRLLVPAPSRFLATSQGSVHTRRNIWTPRKH